MPYHNVSEAGRNGGVSTEKALRIFGIHDTTSTSPLEAKITTSRRVPFEKLNYEREMKTTECQQNDITEKFTALRVKITLKGDAPYAIGKLFESWSAESSGKDVSVKVLRLMRKEKVDETFLSRSLTWSHLEHENVLNLWGIHVVNSRLGLVSPRLKNGNILSYLDNNPLHNRLKSITEIAAGLSYIHTLNHSLVHRVIVQKT